MAKKDYVAKAGHLAVMSEFLLRYYNVAMPEVDLGSDIFVVSDGTGGMWRVQVKTAIGEQRSTGWRGTYSVSLKQLKHLHYPDLFYIFAIRCESRWEFLIMKRVELLRQHESLSVGSSSGGDLVMTITFRPTSVLCSRQDWQVFRNDWSQWPVIDPE